MTKLLAIASAASESTENEFIIYSQGSRAIDECNRQIVHSSIRFIQIPVCVSGVSQKGEKIAKLLPSATVYTFVALRSLKS